MAPHHPHHPRTRGSTQHPLPHLRRGTRPHRLPHTSPSRPRRRTQRTVLAHQTTKTTRARRRPHHTTRSRRTRHPRKRSTNTRCLQPTSRSKEHTKTRQRNHSHRLLVAQERRNETTQGTSQTRNPNTNPHLPRRPRAAPPPAPTLPSTYRCSEYLHGFSTTKRASGGAVRGCGRVASPGSRRAAVRRFGAGGSRPVDISVTRLGRDFS